MSLLRALLVSLTASSALASIEPARSSAVRSGDHEREPTLAGLVRASECIVLARCRTTENQWPEIASLIERAHEREPRDPCITPDEARQPLAFGWPEMHRFDVLEVVRGTVPEPTLLVVSEPRTSLAVALPRGDGPALLLLRPHPEYAGIYTVVGQGRGVLPLQRDGERVLAEMHARLAFDLDHEVRSLRGYRSHVSVDAVRSLIVSTPFKRDDECRLLPALARNPAWVPVHPSTGVPAVIAVQFEPDGGGGPEGPKPLPERRTLYAVFANGDVFEEARDGGGVVRRRARWMLQTIEEIAADCAWMQDAMLDGNRYANIDWGPHSSYFAISLVGPGASAFVAVGDTEWTGLVNPHVTGPRWRDDVTEWRFARWLLARIGFWNHGDVEPGRFPPLRARSAR